MTHNFTFALVSLMNLIVYYWNINYSESDP